MSSLSIVVSIFIGSKVLMISTLLHTNYIQRHVGKAIDHVLLKQCLLSELYHYFQIFRETKEKEIQNLLRAKRDLESKLSKVAPEMLPGESLSRLAQSVCCIECVVSSLASLPPGSTL